MKRLYTVLALLGLTMGLMLTGCGESSSTTGGSGGGAGGGSTNTPPASTNK